MRTVAALMLFFLGPLLCCEGRSNISGLIRRVLDASAAAIETRADLELAELEFRKEDRSWLPKVAVDSPNLLSLTRTGTENVVVADALPLAGDKNILSFTSSASVAQRLPGAGNATIQASQQTEYAPDYRAWRQTPSASLVLSQSLGPGAFGRGPDPASETARLRVEAARLVWEQTKQNLVTEALATIGSFEVAEASLAAAEASAEAAAYRLEVAKERAAQGSATKADLWRAESEAARADRSRDKALYEREGAADAWRLLFGVEAGSLDDSDPEAVLALLSATGEGGRSLAIRAADNRSIADAAAKRLAEVDRAPTLSLSISASPDSNAHYFTSGWADSWSVFADKATPLSITASLGLRYAIPNGDDASIEYLGKDLSARKFEAERRGVIEEESAERSRKTAEADRLRLYRSSLDAEVTGDAQLAADRESLLTRGEISKEEALGSRIASLQLRAERISTTWDLIKLEAEIAALKGIDLSLLLAPIGP